LNEKNETCHILVPNELEKCQTFNSTIRPAMKSIIHQAKHNRLT